MALALTVALLAVPCLAQRNARVLQRNLSELVGDASTIVLGRVVSVKTEPHPQYQNLMTVVVTLQVQEVWKGKTATAGQTFTFRSFVDHPLDIKDKLGYSGEQDMLLMLTRVSDIGLCSPAGLEQGRFRVTTDAAGNRQVMNSLSNAGLMARMEKTAPNLAGQISDVHARQVIAQRQAGPIALADFKTIVQALIANP
jgi:hypothetical protein